MSILDRPDKAVDRFVGNEVQHHLRRVARQKEGAATGLLAVAALAGLQFAIDQVKSYFSKKNNP